MPLKLHAPPQGDQRQHPLWEPWEEGLAVPRAAADPDHAVLPWGAGGPCNGIKE
jgi:hypothetical protein